MENPNTEELKATALALGLITFLDWFKRQDEEYVRRWFGGEISDEEVLERFANPRPWGKQ